MVCFPLCRRAPGSPLHNEGPGCPPDDAAAAFSAVRQQQGQESGPGQQTGALEPLARAAQPRSDGTGEYRACLMSAL